jgi:CxxC motif-containing protein (DUF1111 family)
MIGYNRASLILLVFLTASFGCHKLLPSAPENNEVLAAPISTLSGDQLALHIAGDVEFARVFGTNDGLGPIFVQNSCESCHVGDGKGNPFNNLTRFGNYDNEGVWNSLQEQGGPQLQHRALAGYQPENLPAEVSSSEFLAPNVTGLGYLAAVTDETILSMSDPNDLDGDGISGTVNLVDAPEWLIIDPRYHDEQADGKYIGRFGRKAAAINLLMQTVGAYKQDMGITSDFDPVDPINFGASVFADDAVADPEIPAATVSKVAFYLQTLEAPQRRSENDSDVLTGESLFIDVGCGSCHIPSLETGPSEISALNYAEFYPYTDMLMHDMGSELDDNYTEGIAETSEWRTMPLWGLGLQHDSQGSAIFLMHDGRAASYEEAINLHGGEGSSSRNAYQALEQNEKELLIQFLKSL